VALVEDGEIDRVPAEAGEEEIAEEIEATEGIDGIGAIEEVVAAIYSGADPDSVDSSSKESIADMAMTVPILTTCRPASNSKMGKRQIRRSSKGGERTTIRGKGSSKDLRHQTTPEQSKFYGTAPLIF
jgi:hypothetical protein